MVSNLHVIK